MLAVLEHASSRIRILGATAHPSTSWVVQAAKNLVMDLEDASCRARFLIRDRDGKFPGLCDAVLKDAGIEVVLSGVRIPRMNSIMERWVQTCRRELLDRTLVWGQCHLLHALREFEQFYNSRRPHQGIANARPLRPLPVPLAHGSSWRTGDLGRDLVYQEHLHVRTPPTPTISQTSQVGAHWPIRTENAYSRTCLGSIGISRAVFSARFSALNCRAAVPQQRSYWFCQSAMNVS